MACPIPYGGHNQRMLIMAMQKRNVKVFALNYEVLSSLITNYYI